MIYLELFLMFLKLGAFTFGGGAAMMPFLEDEAVKNRGWLTSQEFVDFVAVSESTPGPFAVNIATYIGVEKAGFFGAVCATFGLVLPSFVIILLIARFYEKFKKNNLVKGAMKGLTPVSIGMVTAAVVSIGSVVFFPNGFSFDTFISYNFITSAIICGLMVFLCLKKLHPMLIVALSGTMGIGFGFLEKLLVKV
ncbi:MAG: chromate transporter [Ruminococcus sp.]|nr:chromate transporter [Ruminococcus sp.]